MISLSFAPFTQRTQSTIGKCNGLTSNPVPQDIHGAWHKKYTHYKFSKKNCCVFTLLYMQHDRLVIQRCKNTKFLQKLKQTVNKQWSLVMDMKSMDYWFFLLFMFISKFSIMCQYENLELINVNLVSYVELCRV